MAITVEHDERRKNILEKALAVFVDDGFEGATFQKIADRCGITRTILYLYFKNKREIFNFSIKQLLLSIEANINKIRTNKSLSSIDKIINVLYAIFKLLEQNQQLLYIILNCLLHTSKSGSTPEALVRRRTVKMRHIMASMVIEGIKTGDLKEADIKTTGDYIYSFVEAGIFQLVILKRNNLDELRETAAFAVKQLGK